MVVRINSEVGGLASKGNVVLEVIFPMCQVTLAQQPLLARLALPAALTWHSLTSLYVSSAAIAVSTFLLHLTHNTNLPYASCCIVRNVRTDRAVAC